MSNQRDDKFYDDQAHQLFKKLGIDESNMKTPTSTTTTTVASGTSFDSTSASPSASSKAMANNNNSSAATVKQVPRPPVTGYSDMNVIHDHPNGTIIFCGNQNAARNIGYLKQHNVTHVVNCTHGMGAIPNYHEGVLKYYTFPISGFWEHLDSSTESVYRFTDPLFAYIDSALNQGGNVFVHCLAGAHRAGTTSCACIMHYEGLPAAQAIRVAKSRRSIIDPICNFPEFLQRLERAEAARKKN